MSTGGISTFRPSVYAALALAFSSFGDAFLYPYLPLHGDHLGMSVAWIGILLSINRFARIFTNGIIARACAVYGFRLVTIVAVSVAIFSTVGYGFSLGIFSWVIFRVCWGLSYSVLRISAISYALDHPQQGFSLGLSKSLQEAGPMLTLFVAPLFLFALDTKLIFIILSVASLPGLYFAFHLPKKFSKVMPFSVRRFLKIPSTFNLLTFGSAILIDGIVVVTLGILFLKHHTQLSALTASILAAAYLGYRRVCLLIFSPVGGWIADKFGLDRVFMISFIMTLAGLIFLSTGWIEIGAILVFAFYSILSALTPGAASLHGKVPLEAVSENATWRDVGAALGTLTGGLLLESDFITSYLLAGTCMMGILLLFYFNKMSKNIALVRP